MQDGPFGSEPQIKQTNKQTTNFEKSEKTKKTSPFYLSIID